MKYYIISGETSEERWKVIHFVKSLAFGDDFKYASENQNNTEVN